MTRMYHIVVQCIQQATKTDVFVRQAKRRRKHKLIRVAKLDGMLVGS